MAKNTLRDWLGRGLIVAAVERAGLSSPFADESQPPLFDRVPTRELLSWAASVP